MAIEAPPNTDPGTPFPQQPHRRPVWDIPAGTRSGVDYVNDQPAAGAAAEGVQAEYGTPAPAQGGLPPQTNSQPETTVPTKVEPLSTAEMEELYRNSSDPAKIEEFGKRFQALSPADQTAYGAFRDRRDLELVNARLAAKAAATEAPPVDQDTQEQVRGGAPLTDMMRARLHNLIAGQDNAGFKVEFDALPPHQQKQVTKELADLAAQNAAEQARQLPEAPKRKPNPGRLAYDSKVTGRHDEFVTDGELGDYDQDPNTWSLGMLAAVPADVRSKMYDRSPEELAAFNDREFALSQMAKKGKLYDGSLGVTTTYGLAPEQVTPQIIAQASDAEIQALGLNANNDRFYAMPPETREAMMQRAHDISEAHIARIQAQHIAQNEADVARRRFNENESHLTTQEAANLFLKQDGLLKRAARGLRSIFDRRTEDEADRLPDTENRVAEHMADTYAVWATHPNPAVAGEARRRLAALHALETARRQADDDLRTHNAGQPVYTNLHPEQFLTANVDLSVPSLENKTIIDPDTGKVVQTPSTEAAAAPRLTLTQRATQLGERLTNVTEAKAASAFGWMLNTLEASRLLTREPNGPAEMRPDGSRPLSRAKIAATIGVIVGAYFGTRWGISHLGAEDVKPEGGGMAGAHEQIQAAPGGIAPPETPTPTPETGHVGRFDTYQTTGVIETAPSAAPQPATPVAMEHHGTQSITLWDAEQHYAAETGHASLSSDQANAVTEALLKKNNMDWGDARGIRVINGQAFFNNSPVVQLTPQEVQAALDQLAAA